MTTGVVADRPRLSAGSEERLAMTSSTGFVGPFGAFEGGGVGLVDIRLMVLVVIAPSWSPVDVRLEGVVCVGKIGNFACHQGTP